VHEIPAAIDTQVATLALASRDTEIDGLTPAQKEYLDSWRQGS
jgi:adenosylhomocysteinase